MRKTSVQVLSKGSQVVTIHNTSDNKIYVGDTLTGTLLRPGDIMDCSIPEDQFKISSIEAINLEDLIVLLKASKEELAAYLISNDPIEREIATLLLKRAL